MTLLWRAGMKFVHQHGDYVTDVGGRRFIAQVYAAERPDHAWEAWCVFFPGKGDDFVVTDRETTQSGFDAIRYWASGLTHRYYEGALNRALRRDSSAALARHDEDDDVRRQQHVWEAEAYAAAAEAARERAYEHELTRRAARRGVRFG
jgi:hypothetical protein